ncbi:P-loop containing nucleoside triphosphate hydrolase protein [Glomus cerebriforme]|uniref:P-loop containing nucleoside triphosphate hydrolase protein n=1 Tax=Glomus cerebriforme TaxID=658196 RepID=A0A397TBP0_9GLOM|nr:P-loop containing nucleoside triphosphate hydrolase protein [Glomus cerebriforme]
MFFLKITQMVHKTIFPTYFITRQIHCFQLLKPFSRTLMTWNNLYHKNKLLKNQLEVLQKEKNLIKVQQTERRRKITKVNLKRRWIVNNTIQNEMRNYVYFIDLEETNILLLDMILRGEFVALYGAKASGKSTRVVQVMEKLKSQGIICIYITFKQFNMKTINTFWSALGIALHINAPKYFGQDDIKSANDFILKFQKEQWNDNHVVLFIDEFDILFEAYDYIKSSFLGTIRAIKNSRKNYALLSLVIIGSFNILHLDSNRIITSSFRNPNFTLEQVQTIYKEFENDTKITIDPEVIKDIYIRTNGHASLVCLCGKAIHLYLISELNRNRKLSFSTWLNFTINSIHDIIADYNIFKKMIITLTKKKEVIPAIEFL